LKSNGGGADLFLRVLLLLTLACAPAVAQDQFRHIRCLHQISCGGFDVILVIGQSNATSRGLSRRPVLTSSNERIWQLGRGGVDYAVVPAFEPLMHVTSASDGMGFALPFARYYRDEFLDPDREILIIPAANGSTSVARPDGYWRPGGQGYQDVHARLTSALHPYRDARLVAILWHQGESDWNSDQQEYRRLTTELLTTIRDEFDPSGEVPIVLGELAKSFQRTTLAGPVGASIKQLADTIPHAGLALSEGLLTRGETLNDENGDLTHFNSNSQLEFGKRYFCAFTRIAHQESALARHPYCERFSEAKTPLVASWFYRALNYLGL
jgi:hypothetical protein